MRCFLSAVLFLTAFVPLRATDPERDFSGKWVLDRAASNARTLGEVAATLDVTEESGRILCSGGGAQWSYALDGSDSRTEIGGESRISVVKWEGAALLVNTLVSGPENYSIMDRWELSRDRSKLTIARQIVRASGEAEGKLVYRHEDPGWHKADAATAGVQPAPVLPEAPQKTLERPPEAGPGDIRVPAGTRVLLSLVGEISTKHAKEGDRVYLRTDVPVAENGRVVIPRGSDVQGTITRTKRAGQLKGKGELFIRFDSLILPNGVSRDFRARPSGDEGGVEGQGGGANPRTVMEGAGMGATIGAITRGLPGAAIGGGAGALAGVLLSRKRDVVLRPGTHVEMVLDRDLVFHPEELGRR